MTLLPSSFLTRLHKHALVGSRRNLQDILELREYVTQGEAEGREVVAQMKREAAAAMMVNLWTVYRSLWIVRDYAPTVLRYWLDCGFGMSHIEVANREWEAGGWESPVALIEEAISRGNGEGQPMTCAEFWDFATGGNRPPQEKKLSGLKQSFLKFSNRLSVVLKWNEDKRAEFEQRLSDLWKEFTK